MLDRPRDNTRRTAAFPAFLAWVFTIFAAGATDRIYVQTLISYEGQVWFFRAAALVLPVAVFFVAKRMCEELLGRESHPLRTWTGAVVRPRPEGGYETIGNEEAPRRAPLGEGSGAE